ncbi:chemotaxis-specific protein-glutamate methyltransferase CheB [Bacteroidota bacterium]
MEIKDKIKVLVIENNSDLRENLKKEILKDSGLELIGAVPDIQSTKNILSENKPDVIALDIELSGMDGIEFLRNLLTQNPIPVVIIGSMTQKGKYSVLQAMESGAVDFVTKPSTDIPKGLDNMIIDIRRKLKSAKSANLACLTDIKKNNVTKNEIKAPAGLSEETDKFIAIGSSRGSTLVIKKILTQLPQTMPGIVIVHHLPRGFTKIFADKLNELSKLHVKEAENGDIVANGTVLIAPGDLHLKVIRSGGRFQVAVENGEKINGQRPSIDVMMHSVAEQAGLKAVGVLLSGISTDGAHGLLAMKRAGAKNISLTQETAIFYNLANSASELGAIDKQFSIDELVQGMIQLI